MLHNFIFCTFNFPKRNNSLLNAILATCPRTNNNDDDIRMIQFLQCEKQHHSFLTKHTKKSTKLTENFEV